MREATIICRLSARNGLEFYRRLHEELPKRGIKIVEAHMVRRHKELQTRVRHAVKSGKELIVVIGGDGTQTAAVAELAHTDSVLAVVPAGTGNSFALSLGIRPDIEQVVDMIGNGKEMRIDLGVVNGTYFANFATIGLPAAAANQTPKLLKRIVGPIAYGLSAIIPLLRHGPFAMHVRWPGNKLHIMSHQAFVSSGRYYGWQPLLPTASVRSGELAFFTAATRTPIDAVAVNAALVRGQQTGLENAHYFSAKWLTIHTEPRQPVNIDGHELGKTPARFCVVQKALRVLVPADFEAQA
ncbi:MAG TPA: YegS/Rv2252/BmrU family lipid kinase [Candidatus Baltobacteraceae bacterium]|jgi:YegS/Rv2252/BmrU family lipid kinase|nr:YegS/Rv2252/BmrU family lipid kinase [Candidatus Baltobacteraceae bacterium]